MNIQIVFAGFSEAAYKSSIKIGGDLIFVIHSNDKRSKPWVEKIKKEFNSEESVINPYEILQQFETLLTLLKKCTAMNAEVITINLTGATKYGMLASFMLADFLNNSVAKKDPAEVFTKYKFAYLEETTGNIAYFPFQFYFELNRVLTKLYGLQIKNDCGKKPELRFRILNEVVTRGTVELMELTTGLNRSKATITLAIKPLIQSGLITSTRKKVRVVYSVDPKAADLIKTIVKVYELSVSTPLGPQN